MLISYANSLGTYASSLGPHACIQQPAPGSTMHMLQAYSDAATQFQSSKKNAISEFRVTIKHMIRRYFYSMVNLCTKELLQNVNCDQPCTKTE